MNKRKIYALILAMAILTQVAAPSINVLAEEVNTKKIDEKVSLEEDNLKINEKVSLEEDNLKINESLQKKDEIISIPDI
ncbi:hypothetical protein GNF72_16380, partial [Clostridium perfringens]|uniref:hypothetical protein n=1 Tax=Clostridium perfringens TaxID=1502 RepID=UPI002AC61EE1